MFPSDNPTVRNLNLCQFIQGILFFIIQAVIVLKIYCSSLISASNSKDSASTNFKQIKQHVNKLLTVRTKWLVLAEMSFHVWFASFEPIIICLVYSIWEGDQTAIVLTWCYGYVRHCTVHICPCGLQMPKCRWLKVHMLPSTVLTKEQSFFL